MLNDIEYLEWLERNKIPRKNIDPYRGGPSRRVKGGKKNNHGFYPSKKMGRTIQFESDLEFAAIIEMEFDPTVKEYHDQPGMIKFSYSDRDNQRTINYNGTPDFFVIREDSAGFEECMREEELVEESVNPNRFYLDNGVWRCPPGEEYASKLGLYFKVRSSKDINKIYLRNLQYLAYYFSEGATVSDYSYATVKTLVTEKPGISLLDVIRYDNRVRADEINQMIATGEIYVDLNKYVLAEQQYARCFLNEDVALAYSYLDSEPVVTPDTPSYISLEPMTKVVWLERTFTVMGSQNEKITLLDEEGETIHITKERIFSLVEQKQMQMVIQDNGYNEEIRRRFLTADQKDIKIALDRHKAITPYLNGKPINTGNQARDRQLRRWRASFMESIRVCGLGFLGLIPNISQRGNRGSHLDQRSEALLEKVINKHFLNKKQVIPQVVYTKLMGYCNRYNVPLPSEKTFYSRIKRIPLYHATLERKGSAAAYGYESAVPLYLTETTPRHGDRPFQIGHIDHTEADVELVSSDNSSINLGRFTLTFMTDAYDRRILACYATFDKASIRSDMMILRECVRRNGRLPETMVVDHGPDFRSLYFESTLALFNCAIKVRPARSPRSGSVIESLFGIQNKSFIHTLMGNTQITKDVRKMTEENNPKKLAVWTLKLLVPQLQKWCYEVYENLEHFTLGQKPSEMHLQAMRNTGDRLEKRIFYTPEFEILTMPSTRKGTVKVVPGKGVKVNREWYYNSILKNFEKESLPVRFDPDNGMYVYVYLDYGFGKKWVQCITNNTLYHNRSLKELEIITKEERAKKKQYRKKRVQSQGEHAAPFYEGNDKIEEAQLQATKDAEKSQAFPDINGNLSRNSQPVQDPKVVSISRSKKAEVQPTHKADVQPTREEDLIKFEEL